MDVAFLTCHLFCEQEFGLILFGQNLNQISWTLLYTGMQLSTNLDAGQKQKARSKKQAACPWPCASILRNPASSRLLLVRTSSRLVDRSDEDVCLLERHHSCAMPAQRCNTVCRNTAAAQGRRGRN